MGCVCSIEPDIKLDDEWVDEVIAEECKCIPQNIKKNIIIFTDSVANCHIDDEWPVPYTKSDMTLTKQSTQKEIARAAVYSATGTKAHDTIKDGVWYKIEPKIDEQIDETFSDERKKEIKHYWKYQCSRCVINALYEMVKHFDYTTYDKDQLENDATGNNKFKADAYAYEACITHHSDEDVIYISSESDADIKKRQQLQDGAFEALLTRDKPLSIDEVFKSYATKSDKTKIDIKGMTQFFAHFGLILTEDMQQYQFDEFYSENGTEIEFDQFEATFTLTFNNRQNKNSLGLMYELFDIKQTGQVNINDLSRILLAQNNIALADYDQDNMGTEPPRYTTKHALKLARKMMTRLGKWGKYNYKPIDKIYISCDELIIMMKNLTDEDMEVANIENDMCLQFINSNSNTNDEKKDETIADIPKIECAANGSDSDIEITIQLTCDGQKDVDNSKIIVTASYIDDCAMEDIFKDIEKYLNNKYSPLVFTVDEIIDVDSSDHVSRQDVDDKSITTYDLDSIKQKGLHIKLSWIYVVEVYNQTIDCPQMIQLKTTDPLKCDIYHKMLKENESTVENLRHLENDVHFEDPNSEKPQCKFGDECKTFIQMEQNGTNSIEDDCHMILYRHPPRTRTIKLSENIHSLVLKAKSQQCKPLCEPDSRRSVTEYDYTASLLAEVIRNGCRFDLCLQCSKDDECKHGYLCEKCGIEDKCDHTRFQILEIVQQKMNSKRYRQLGLNFQVGHMLALVLYTGCECNYDLCKSQRNGDYKKWKWFDYFLWNAIQMISEKENGKYAVFTGLTSVQIQQQIMKAGYFATYVSTSSQEWIANEFLKGEGMLIRIDPQFRSGDNIKCCDVSWISKFPDESETLFARSVEHDSEDVFRLEVIDMIENKQIVTLKEIDYDELYGKLDNFSQMIDIHLEL